MAGKDNLKPFNTLTEDEQRKIASKGGKKSVEVRRARKTLKEELLLLLSENDANKKISIAQLQKALDGDTKAFEVIRDTIGEKPKEKVENTNVDMSYEEYIKKVEDSDEY